MEWLRQYKRFSDPATFSSHSSQQHLRQQPQPAPELINDDNENNLANDDTGTAVVANDALERQTSSHSSTNNTLLFKESYNPYRVTWDSPDDEQNPRNWSLKRRSFILFVLWINVFALDWAGSGDSQESSKISADFHVSEEAETLSPALYNFGIGLGALFAGPISETVGRNPIYIGSRILQLCWLIGVALAPNFAAKCILRFLAGLGGSIILAIHAASVADLFNIVERTVAWPVIALASFYGPALSPLVGAWIAQSNISWRWTEWISVFISALTLAITILCLPETFAPILLSWKAKCLRKATNEKRWQSEIEQQASVGKRLGASLQRSFNMTFRELVVPLLGLWLVLIYIVVYGFLQGMTYIFGDTYGFSKGLVGTCFVTIIIGVSLWSLSVPVYFYLYKRKMRQIASLNRENGKDFSHHHIPGRDLPEPEYRLWLAVPVAALLPVSLFWIGWSNYRSVSPWSDLGAVTLFGMCWAGIYVAIYQYVLDVYGIYAGSALSMITLCRYWASGMVNLISRPWYSNIGVHHVMTIVGSVAVILAFAPLFLFKYGPGIRKRSKFAGMYSRPGNERLRIGRAMRKNVT